MLLRKMAKKRFNFIGQVLREYRENAKLTQKRLAEDIGIQRNYISKIENSREHPSIELFVKLALYMKTDPSLILKTIIERELESENEDFPWITLYKEID